MRKEKKDFKKNFLVNIMNEKSIYHQILNRKRLLIQEAKIFQDKKGRY